MPVLERQHQLDTLLAALDQMRTRRHGSCVVVSGDAGIGKTTLVEAFLQALPTGVSVLRSGCEALFTARPLGAIADLAERFAPPISYALRQSAPYGGLFPELLGHFRDSPRPSVLVVEDIHWADAGTLDLLRYLARRLRELPLLMVLTHRGATAEVDEGHPLRQTLGDLPPRDTLRLELPALSAAAVQTLARAAHRDGAAVFAATGGNPFYVTELLAADAAGVPPSVRDAVRATLARLPPSARALAEWVSLFPGRVARRELALVAAAADDAESLDACLRCGLMQLTGDSVSFRHEIAREAVSEDMPEHRRAAAHLAILEALSSQGDELAAARLMHHAAAAGHTLRVAALAPRAARQAASTGGHREAARLYALALEISPALRPDDRADLLEALAHEYMLTNRHHDALLAREQAAQIRRSRGDARRLGVNLQWLARLSWFEHGGSPQVFRWAHEAIEVLRTLPPTRELALACSTLSHLCLVTEDLQGAQVWGLRAIELAEELDDPAALCHALNNVGSARLRLADDGAAWNRLARSLAIALEHGFEEDAARAYNNLVIIGIVHHDFTLALRHAEDGIAYCEARGLDFFTVRIRIRRAFAQILMGQWEQAEDDLRNVAELHRPVAKETATWRFVSALLALRRGGPDAPRELAGAVTAMRAAGVDIWFASPSAALAEAAWLQDRSPDVAALVRDELNAQAALGDRWRSGELAFWLALSAARPEVALPELPRPHALELQGDWRGAAAEWQRLSCPYNRALALCGGDEDDLRRALEAFDAMGAAPAAEWVRRRLRERGARGVPRGPQPRTRDDPLGLTGREREVFELARDGLASPEIARRLRRSERTIEHHVAAIYRKLGVSTRAELVAQHPPRSKPPGSGI